MRQGSIRWKTTALIVGGGLVSALLTAAGVSAWNVSHPVNAAAIGLGSVLSSPRAMEEFRTVVPLVLAIGLLVSVLTAAVVQAKVSSPILTVAKVAQRITQTHNFEERIAVSSSDELGVLA